MNLASEPLCTLLPLTPALAAVAAALHETCGFSETWDERAFLQLLGMPGVAGRIAIAAPSEAPIGLVLWRVAADESEILTICSRPDHRRRGIARLMLDLAARESGVAGAKRLFLEVAVDNEPARALYEAIGFVHQGRRRGYYATADGPVDALVLAKDLRAPGDPDSPAS